VYRAEVKCQAFANVSELEDFWGILELPKFESFELLLVTKLKEGCKQQLGTVTHKKQSNKRESGLSCVSRWVDR
jgi:hypothetical protein